VGNNEKQEEERDKNKETSAKKEDREKSENKKKKKTNDEKSVNSEKNKKSKAEANYPSFDNKFAKEKLNPEARFQWKWSSEKTDKKQKE